MPASAYVADARRKSFMDLPGETRKLIYGYAVFGNRSEDWGIMTSGDRLTCARPQSSDYGPSSRRFNIAFRTSMYGWSDMRCEPTSGNILTSSRRATAISMISWKISVLWEEQSSKRSDMGPEDGRCHTWCESDSYVPKQIPSTQDLRQFENARTRSQCLHTLLYRNRSTPRLPHQGRSTGERTSGRSSQHHRLTPTAQGCLLKFESCVQREDSCACCGSWYHEPDEFLRFAFSGKRQDALWKAIRQRLGARNTKWKDWNEDTTTDGAKNSRKTNGQVAVRMTRPGWKAEDYIKHAKVMDYQAWLQSSSGPAKTFSQYRCAVEAEEVDGAVTDALQPQKGDIEDGDADEDEDMEDQGENSHEKEHKDGD
jgi:hypothetical protein